MAASIFERAYRVFALVDLGSDCFRRLSLDFSIQFGLSRISSNSINEQRAV
jgi:hypothetical protein